MQRSAGKIWRPRNGCRGEFARSKTAEISRAVFGCCAPAIVGRRTCSTLAPQSAAQRGLVRLMDLDTSLEELTWIPRPRILALRRLALETVGDLLTHYPRRHEDRREFREFPREETIIPVCLCGEVAKTRLMRFGGRKIFEAVLEESGAHALSQPLTCRWFNLHYIQKMIATGQRLVVFGRVKRKGPRLLIDHPEFEVIEDDDEILIHFRRITPIYPSTEGLSQRVLRALIFRLLEQVAGASADVPLPASLSNGEDENALRKIHFPESDQ